MSAKEIIYPHFLHCCQETEDLYWKYIFEDLSYGRAPYGVYFTKGFMCCGFKGKEFSYRVDPHIPVPQLFKEVKTILNVKLGIKSSSDILSTREKFEKTSERLALHECNDWTLLKKKEVRGLLLENFIISQNKNFNRIKQKRLLSSLMLAIQLKIINNEDISIYHGRVTEIKKWEKIQNTNLKDWDFNTKKKVIKTKK
jgi:hypothetical protein